MTTWPISTRVNKPESDEASILDRVDQPVASLRSRKLSTVAEWEQDSRSIIADPLMLPTASNVWSMRYSDWLKLMFPPPRNALHPARPSARLPRPSSHCGFCTCVLLTILEPASVGGAQHSEIF